jgi:hypothetical protein
VSRNKRSDRVANRKACNKNESHPRTNRDIVHWTDLPRFGARVPVLTFATRIRGHPAVNVRPATLVGSQHRCGSKQAPSDLCDINWDDPPKNMIHLTPAP